MAGERPQREKVLGKRLGELLTESAVLDPVKVERALKLQESSHERLGTLLVNLGFISESDLASTLATQLDLPLTPPADYPDAPALEDQVSPEFLKQFNIVPLCETPEQVVVAMSDPLDAYALDAIRLATGKRVSAQVGVISHIEEAIRRQYANGADSMAQIVDDIEGGEPDLDDAEHLRDLASEAPIVRLVNLIIARALRLGASDIHVEPFENQLTVRYRVDGVLMNVEAPPSHSSAAVISRIKVMANLNIAERRLPQDGRIKFRIEGREFDMRISTVPTMHGESVVMRILDKGNIPLEFPALGFGPDILPRFEEVLALPHGIVLVTGPTGSGKTTTLYAALHALNTPDKKILTVEDPVEYQLEGINQIQVKPQIGLTFANALRSILRQDPDVIMIGEMRDQETAKIAVQSALTGHKVFSTVHTNDAASSITRLLDMGVEDYLVTSTVNAVLAQRLVRKLCAACREAYLPPTELVEQLGLDRVPGWGEERSLYRPIGCDECSDTGYRGRTGILELLVINEPVRDAILNHTDSSSINRIAVQDGMRSMYQDGLAKSLAGVTTVEEVVRVSEES